MFHIAAPPSITNGLPNPHKQPEIPIPCSEDKTNIQTQLEQSVKHSITLVFWYKEKVEPIRMHVEVPEFPWFQFSQFEQLVSDLGLTSTSYLECYNPRSRHWEQHRINTASRVEQDQRVLYRVRKSLLEGFPDEDCTGLKDEVDMQTKSKRSGSSPGSSSPPPNETSGRKRPAVEAPTGAALPPAKMMYSYGESPPQQIGPFAVPAGHAYPTGPANQALPQNSFIVPNEAMYANPNGVAAPGLGASASPHSLHPNHPRQDAPTKRAGNFTFQAFAQPPMSIYSPMAPPQTTAAPMQISQPPAKKWPNDFMVVEIAQGFREMDSLIGQRPSVTQRLAFEQVFGCRYVKSTVCRHRAVWRRATVELKEEYEKMGHNRDALWGEFVHKAERIKLMGESNKPAEAALTEPPPPPLHTVEEVVDALTRAPAVASTQPVPSPVLSPTQEPIPMPGSIPVQNLSPFTTMTPPGAPSPVSVYDPVLSNTSA